MKIYDVTVPIVSDMHVYPGDPSVVFKPYQSILNGDSANVSRFCMGTHTGTHVDAPFHFVNSGKTIDQIPLNLLIGRARVVEVTSAKIDTYVLSEINLGDHVRVIFKTRNSYLWDRNSFVQEYVYITPDAASRLVDSGIKVVGIDYLSVEKFGSTDFATHMELLSNDVVIIEGLNLSEIQQGDYELICMPLKIKNGDGAPSRVILRG